MLEKYKLVKLDNINLQLTGNLEVNFEPFYQRERVGDRFFMQSFGSEDITGRFTAFVSGSDVKALESKLKEFKIHFLTLPDWQGLVAIKAWRISRDALETGFSVNGQLAFGNNYEIEFEKADTDNPFKSITTNLDIPQEKEDLEVLVGNAFTRDFETTTFNSNTFEKVVNGLNVINDVFSDLSRGVANTTATISKVNTFLNTTLFSVNNTIASLDRFNVAVGSFAQSVGQILTLPRNTFQNLKNVFDTFKSIFQDPKFGVANFLSISTLSLDSLKERSTLGSMAREANKRVQSIEDTVKILALLNIYELGEQVEFVFENEGRALLQEINKTLYSIEFNDATLRNLLINLHSSFINEVENKISTLPVLKMVNVQVKQTLFNVLYNYSGSLEFFDYVVNINRIRDINNIQGNVLVPISK